MLINHMSKGHSFESFGAVIDVARSTIYLWEKEHPEFSDAKKKAIDKNLLYMESLGLEGMWCVTEKEGNRVHTKSLNTGVYCFFMKNVHRWKDKPDDKEEKQNVSIKLNYDRKK